MILFIVTCLCVAALLAARIFPLISARRRRRSRPPDKLPSMARYAWTPPSGTPDPLAERIADEAGHTLIAGTTGSGKSVFLHSVIRALLLRDPEKAQCVFIDLKRVELSEFRAVPHCIAYADTVEAARGYLAAVSELMEDRYTAMQAEGIKKTAEGAVYVIIDELADLIRLDPRGILPQLEHLGRLGRAANIHLILCTQSPDRRTLCATVQQNMTLTFALRCRSPIESRQIIGIKGAEALPQYGQCLYRDGAGLHQASVPLTSQAEMTRILDHYQAQIA